MTDLRRRLHEVVDVGDPLPCTRGATAADDVLVGVLTARVRRRRGLRAAAAAGLGVVVVAAVAVGGLARAGRGDAPAPAGPGPADVPDHTGAPACGEAVRAAAVPDDLWLSGELRTPEVAPGEPVDVQLVLRAQLGRRIERLHAPFAYVVVLSDGAVVAQGRTDEAGPTNDSTGGSSIETFSGPVDVVPCAGDALPPGAYEVLATQTWLDPAVDEPLVELTAGPWPLTVAEPPVAGPAPACGDPAPTPTGDERLGVGVDVPRELPATGRLAWTARWWAEDAALEIVRTDVDVVVVRGGAVVGTTGGSLTWTDTTQGVPTAEADALTLSDAGPVTACGPSAALEPGDYDVVVTVTVRTADGEAVVRSVGPLPLAVGSATS